MQVLTLDQAQDRLDQTMNDVCRDHEPAVITRRKGQPVVMLSLADYNALAETLYLLGSSENAAWLRESLRQYENSKKT